MIPSAYARAVVSERVQGRARVKSEHIITLPEAVRIWPEVTCRKLLKWSISGRNGIRLDATKVRGRNVTSLEALRRFRDATGM